MDHSTTASPRSVVPSITVCQHQINGNSPHHNYNTLLQDTPLIEKHESH